MQCKQCNHNNREGHRFCTSCGAELSVICQVCGFTNDPGDNFCGNCGKTVSQVNERANTECRDSISDDSRLSLPGELRQVTILFADIAEYTRISSEKDPEEIHQLLSSFFESADNAVQSYGGRVDKHIGDAVMAVFGAPVAHGNDPERAVRAAVDIHKSMKELSSELGMHLSVHIGIACGQVIASGLGSKAHQEYTVTGQSVNLASRLAEMANANETLISDQVHFANHKFINADMLGNVKIKGLNNPVRVWRLISIADKRSKIERAPIVGRTSELRQFHAIIETCNETHSGHFLCVRGEAGIGKTRLVEEFTVYAECKGFKCHTGLVLDFGVGRGQDALRAIVHGLLGLNMASDHTDRARAVQSVVSRGLLGEDQKVFLYDILDVPKDPNMLAVYDAMDNETRNKGKQKAVAMLIQRVSLETSLMIVVEDLHWADPMTLAYLTELVGSSSNHPLILVMTSRLVGDQLEKMRQYATGNMTFTILDLGPLKEDESYEFANKFFVAANNFTHECVRRAEGNPLFLEQLLLSAKDEMSEEVPGSVNSLVLARIDHLSLKNKHALQASSILGQRFSLNVLRFLIDDDEYNPDELVTHYLIRPMEGDYIFAHALVWESVYSSILRKRSKELHERAAQWFSDKDPLLYAEHLEHANNPAAAKAYAEAGRSLMKIFHYEHALLMIDRGIAVASQKGDICNLFMLKGQCLREIGLPADSISAYQKALEASLSDVDKCRAWIGLAAGMRVTDNFDEALAALANAEHVAHTSNLAFERSQIHYYRGNLYFPLGNIDGCLKQHKLALETAQQAESPECEARALSGLGDAYYSQGKMITSLKYFRQCIDLCRTHGLGRIKVENQYMISWNRIYLNEIQGSLDDAIEAIEASVRAGNKRAELVSRSAAARSLYEINDYDSAEKHIIRVLELVDQLGAKRFIANCSNVMAKIHLARDGFRTDTVDLMRDTLLVSRKTGIGFQGPWVLSTLALVLDDKESSLEALNEGEDILKRGCVGHNYFEFYRNAMEVAWRYSDWSLIDNYADALEDFIKPEPIPWAEHFIKWGRALSSHGKEHSRETAERLRLIRKEAEELNLLSCIRTLDQALAVH